jgi:hypothetical protein
LVTRRCIQDTRLWAHRCTTPSASLSLNNWCNSFDPP